jgi:1,4-dihydroxy-2-naphthoate octaprenyltransferase
MSLLVNRIAFFVSAGGLLVTLWSCALPSRAMFWIGVVSILIGVATGYIAFRIWKMPRRVLWD